MALETLALEHLPETHKVHLAFFQNIQNASFLHEQLLARNSDFEYAFIDASVVVSRLQVLSAIFKATTTAVDGTLKTPNVHSEIVASLTSSNNIAEAYRRFGISTATKDLIVVKVTFPTDAKPDVLSSDDIWQHLHQHVKGDPALLTDDALAKVTDLSKVRKYYKLNGLNWLDNIKDEKAKRGELEALILGGMALRGL
ncbi:kinase binding protein [Sarocladium implicatum]|nr:kinase binding protein [Sarocladium implicatum]